MYTVAPDRKRAPIWLSALTRAMDRWSVTFTGVYELRAQRGAICRHATPLARPGRLGHGLGALSGQRPLFYNHCTALPSMKSCYRID